MPMDVSLFTAQLNQLLQTPAEPDHLEGVCGLLRSHTGAGICVHRRDGRVIFECLQEKITVEPSQEPTIFTTDCLTLRREASEVNPQNFTPDEKLAANIALCVITVLLCHRKELYSAEKKRSAKAVRAIINSLSFSELEAATHILKALDKSEGVLIAGNIAVKLGIARSVVTSALRKLEGANLIETRSLGMKGTYVRVKSELLFQELAKLTRCAR